MWGNKIYTTILTSFLSVYNLFLLSVSLSKSRVMSFSSFVKAQNLYVLENTNMKAVESELGKCCLCNSVRNSYMHLECVFDLFLSFEKGSPLHNLMLLTSGAAHRVEAWSAKSFFLFFFALLWTMASSL